MPDEERSGPPGKRGRRRSQPITAPAPIAPVTKRAKAPRKPRGDTADWDGVFEFERLEGVAKQTILDTYAVELEDEHGNLPEGTPPYPGISLMRRLAIRELLNHQGAPPRGPRPSPGPGAPPAREGC